MGSHDSVSLPIVGEAQVVRLGSVGSTQDVARELPVGSIVIADHQTSGRGRLDRRWEAPPGAALLVSFVLAPYPLLSLAAGVAAAEACGPRVRLKWPNDLLLGERKLGGILVEATRDKAVCGIGINLTWSPPGAAQLDQPRDEVFERLRGKIEAWTAAAPGQVLGRWRGLSATLGRRVRVDVSGAITEGLAEEIGPHGELIVDGKPIVAGSVTHL
jgi:BirA family transcriptional regulator, biotin operon repressor / biotin---[acetyl-CoA-carboxylase] ligase